MVNSKQIMMELKKSLIGQDEYARQLAILGYKHKLNQQLIEEGKTPIINNLLVVGETGTGKTFGAKKLAGILDIPFYEVDCSNIVQTGYRGVTTVEHILYDAKDKLGSGVLHCIIYLDEFDKVYDAALANRGDGPAQMQNFLKILEPNEVTIQRDRNRNYPLRINTAGITYIATGSFDYVRKLKNGKKQKMGFAADKEACKDLSKEDIIAAGYLPELIGRFGTIINLNKLNEEDYYRILLDSSDSAYTQYRDFFKAAQVSLKIDKKVFKKVAEETYKTGTGARGLSAMLNHYLDESVFEVSSDDTISAIELKLVKDEIVCGYERKKYAKTLNKYPVHDHRENLSELKD